jgi:hypothetical protein
VAWLNSTGVEFVIGFLAGVVAVTVFKRRGD